MDKKILNEIHRNKELMGINEQGIIDSVKRGLEKGRQLGKKLFNKKTDSDDSNTDTNNNTPLETGNLSNNVFFEMYPEYTWFIKENTFNDDNLTRRNIEDSIKKMLGFDVDFTNYSTKYRNSDGKREVIIEIPSNVIEEFFKNK